LVDALNIWGEPLPRRTATDPVVRIVLAEAAASPGPLHYILESEGFQILGSASDDADLTRILSQRIEPDVIVVDAAVPATTVMTAQEFAPASELIVVWPEGIVPPGSADQVFPDLVFEELGPAVRRAAERNRLRHPIEDEPDEVADVTWIEPQTRDIPSIAAGRTAARVLVGTVAVIASIVVTMGASFALQGWRATHQVGPARVPVSTTSAPGRGDGSSVLGATPLGAAPSQHTSPRCEAAHGSGPNEHASTKAQHAADCSNRGGSPRAADHRQNGAARDTGRGSGHGDQGAGQGDQGSGPGQGSTHGQGSGQGDHGSGQGNHGSGQGDQGSGSGDQGSGQGDQGSGSGDQGSSGSSSADPPAHPRGMPDPSAGHGRASHDG
jgi:hypothetical protein